MENMNRRREAREWKAFEEWALTVPVAEAHDRLVELIASGNYHARKFEEKLLKEQKSGISRPSIYRGDHDTDIGGASNGKNLPYSGLYRPRTY